MLQDFIPTMIGKVTEAKVGIDFTSISIVPCYDVS